MLTESPKLINHPLYLVLVQFGDPSNKEQGRKGANEVRSRF
jgi:hypothetical protein